MKGKCEGGIQVHLDSESERDSILKKWYVFKTQASRESLAEWHLRNQHFEVFVPKIKVTRRQGIKLANAVQPLFPGYGFILFDGSPENWRSINGSRGVSYLISADGKALALSNKFIDSLLACRVSLDDGIVELGNDLVAGKKVELMTGPFVSQFGILQELDGKGRVKILMQLLGGTVPITVSATALRAIN